MRGFLLWGSFVRRKGVLVFGLISRTRETINMLLGGLIPITENMKNKILFLLVVATGFLPVVSHATDVSDPVSSAELPYANTTGPRTFQTQYSILNNQNMALVCALWGSGNNVYPENSNLSVNGTPMNFIGQNSSFAGSSEVVQLYISTSSVLNAHASDTITLTYSGTVQSIARCLEYANVDQDTIFVGSQFPANVSQLTFSDPVNATTSGRSLGFLRSTNVISPTGQQNTQIWFTTDVYGLTQEFSSTTHTIGADGLSGSTVIAGLVLLPVSSGAGGGGSVSTSSLIFQYPTDGTSTHDFSRWTVSAGGTLATDAIRTCPDGSQCFDANFNAQIWYYSSSSIQQNQFTFMDQGENFEITQPASSTGIWFKTFTIDKLHSLPLPFPEYGTTTAFWKAYGVLNVSYASTTQRFITAPISFSVNNGIATPTFGSSTIGEACSFYGCLGGEIVTPEEIMIGAPTFNECTATSTYNFWDPAQWQCEFKVFFFDVAHFVVSSTGNFIGGTFRGLGSIFPLSVYTKITGAIVAAQYSTSTPATSSIVVTMPASFGPWGGKSFALLSTGMTDQLKTSTGLDFKFWIDIFLYCSLIGAIILMSIKLFHTPDTQTQ